MNPVTAFIIACWLGAAFDAAIGLVALWTPAQRAAKKQRRVTIGVATLFLAATVAFLSFAVQALVLRLADLSFFGIVRLAYVAGVFVPPALGLFLLYLAWRGKYVRVPWHARISAALLLVPIPVGIYASFIAPYQLVIERQDVPVAALTQNDQPIRITVLADIQTDRVTGYERTTIARTLAEQPDLIVIPGDIFQGTQREFDRWLPALRELFAQLDAPGGVYATTGNVDNPLRLVELFAGTNVRLLQNEVRTITLHGRTIAIGGQDWLYDTPAARAVRQQLQQSAADIRILLGHTPDCALEARPEDRIDLIISGHTHGGQVALPGIGPLVTATGVPRAVAAGGLHTVRGQTVYVSRGVGFERSLSPPLRLFCPPEISVLTLRSAR